MAVAAQQINILVITILGTGTLGAVSWLGYAFRIFQLPVGILGVSLANSNMVYFSMAWKNNQRDLAIQHLRTSYELAWMCLICAFCVFFLLSEQTVAIIFQRGEFDALDTHNTAKALCAYLIGLPFYGIYKIFSPVFFAIERPKIALASSLIAIAANIVFCTLLVGSYGFSVLALGASLSIALNCLIQGCLLVKLLRLPWHFFCGVGLIKYFIAGGLCWAMGAWMLRRGIGDNLIDYFLCVAAMGGVYGAILALFRFSRSFRV